MRGGVHGARPGRGRGDARHRVASAGDTIVVAVLQDRAPSRDDAGGHVASTSTACPHQRTARAGRRTRALRLRYSQPPTPRPTTCSSSAPAAATTSPSRCATGAKHVDAVEIDPRAATSSGRDRTPTGPTTTPGSTSHIDDGRAFLERTDDEVRPDPARPARLAHARARASRRCGWRATCSPRGDRGGPRPPASPAACSRCTTTTASAGWSTATPAPSSTVFGTRAVRATRSSGAAPARRCSSAERPTPRRAVRLPDRPGSARAVGAPEPSTDDHPFPYLARPAPSPRFYLVDARADPARCRSSLVRAGRRAARGRWRRTPTCSSWARLPAARDQERRAVRAAVRHHLVRQRARVRWASC